MIRFDPPHGGYPGELIVQDEYLRCAVCAWAYPLDAGDDECSNCGSFALEVVRAHPVESTIHLF